MRRIGLSRASIYTAMARHEFPAAIALTARGVGWIEDEVDSWLASRVAKSRSDDYFPASKMPKALRERQRNGTVPTIAASPEARA
jgi:prophage regulatory protein